MLALNKQKKIISEKNMELLIDTNIILDVLQKREPWFNSSYSIFAACIQGKHRGYVSAHSLSDLFFILRKSHDLQARKNTIILLCTHFTVISESGNDYMSVVQNEMLDDLEDGLQIRCAENYKLDFIITRNIKDFKDSAVPAIEPENFLSKTILP